MVTINSAVYEKAMCMTMWNELTNEQKRECYKSYCENINYEFGDNAKPMSYEEWCEESEQLGEALF